MSETWNPPIDGCSGCATTGGRAVCPMHGPQRTVVVSELPASWSDAQDIKRDLRRIIELLERIAGVRR